MYAITCINALCRFSVGHICAVLTYFRNFSNFLVVVIHLWKWSRFFVLVNQDDITACALHFSDFAGCTWVDAWKWKMMQSPKSTLNAFGLWGSRCSALTWEINSGPGADFLNLIKSTHVAATSLRARHGMCPVWNRLFLHPAHLLNPFWFRETHNHLSRSIVFLFGRAKH